MACSVLAACKSAMRRKQLLLKSRRPWEFDVSGRSPSFDFAKIARNKCVPVLGSCSRCLGRV